MVRLFTSNSACLAFKYFQRQLLRQQYVAYRQIANGQKAPSPKSRASWSEFVNVQVISVVDSVAVPALTSNYVEAVVVVILILLRGREVRAQQPHATRGCILSFLNEVQENAKKPAHWVTSRGALCQNSTGSRSFLGILVLVKRLDANEISSSLGATDETVWTLRARAWHSSPFAGAANTARPVHAQAYRALRRRIPAINLSRWLRCHLSRLRF
jgi:hypothetical protein